jgi:hypothetical protein
MLALYTCVKISYVSQISGVIFLTDECAETVGIVDAGKFLNGPTGPGKRESVVCPRATAVSNGCC